MTSIYKIQTKHLNEHSTLYGGQLLEWIDNYCFAKTEPYSDLDSKFVTKVSHCEFIEPANLGEIITLKLTDVIIGNTSIRFEYEVVTAKKLIAKGYSIFVRTIDGKPTKIEQTKKNE